MIFRGEIIGKKIEVIKSSNKSLVGLSGKVVDETKNMIIFDSGKMIQKESVWINVMDGKKTFEIDGRLLIAKPEDRLKKAVAKK